MLIIRAYVNERQIDQINIHNKGEFALDEDGTPEYYVYSVEKPEGISRKFVHKRSDGWKPLACTILKHLISLDEVENKSNVCS